MTPVFVDTSLYLALFSHDDAWHAEAVAWSRQNTRPLVLTEFILIELGNALSGRPARPLFLDLVRRLRSQPATEIVPASTDLVDKGLRLFAERPDKDWSLTDCISFVVMRERGLLDAAAADHHFEQAGFTILLKQTPPR